MYKGEQLEFGYVDPDRPFQLDMLGRAIYVGEYVWYENPSTGNLCRLKITGFDFFIDANAVLALVDNEGMAGAVYCHHLRKD